MKINMDKTVIQHVFRRDPITVTKTEVAKVETKYVHKCDFCLRRFKTDKPMQLHRTSCVHNYNTTEEIFVLEKIAGVFGHKDVRWFLVK